ncbi:glycosyltransferase [Teredinibacter haidensis]|uniref:glycosyltransferase n=1 Tax=Teredinibacter haidensis TaxID=2731755 RepID=UPI000948C316|nr:glycosyltransferase [Teredinibacter haidensis]
MRKVLHIRCTGQLLGAERVILELGKFLPEFSYHPIIGIPVEANLPRPEFAIEAEKMGFDIVQFPIKHAFDISAPARIRRYINEHNIDVVHTHGYREDFYAHHSRNDTHLVATNHLWKRTNLRLKLYAKIDALLLRSFAHIVAVSNEIAEEMKTIGLPDNRISTISNGVDLQRLVTDSNLRNELGIPGNRIVIGTLSSLTTEKAVDVAIRALSDSSLAGLPVHLLVVGDGPEMESLLSLTQALNLNGSVTFTGRRQDIPEILQTIDIFAMPSLKEGLPMALLEAMAAGKPSIVTPVGEIPTVIDHTCGRLIEGDPSSFAEAIKTLASNTDLRHTLGDNARQRISLRYSSHQMAKSYADVYNKLLDQGNSK